MTYIDLITDSGQIIRIECPEKFEDECHESLEHAMKCGDWWSPQRFDGCKAEYLGMLMGRIAMNKVMGML